MDCCIVGEGKRKTGRWNAKSSGQGLHHLHTWISLRGSRWDGNGNKYIGLMEVDWRALGLATDRHFAARTHELRKEQRP